jgi:hypothetical protein
VLRQDEGLRRRHVLVTRAERARLELLGRRRLERRTRRARPFTACGRYRDAPAGQLVNAKLRGQSAR